MRVMSEAEHQMNKDKYLVIHVQQVISAYNHFLLS